MTLKQKANELRQKKAKLVDRTREIVERVEKENRAMTREEEQEYKDLAGDGDSGGQILELAKRISMIERQLGMESQDRDEDPEEEEEGPDGEPRSGRKGLPRIRFGCGTG